MNEEGLASIGADHFHHSLTPGIVQVGYHDLGTFPCQRGGTSCADPGCAARYDCDFVLYLAHGVLLPLCGLQRRLNPAAII
jgi:hypothetical protein